MESEKLFNQPIDHNLSFFYYSTVLYRYTSGRNGRPVKAAEIYTETEHCIKNDAIDPIALRVIKQLRDSGFDAYIVGGAVRDLLLGKEPKDFDLVTDARPTKIKKIFRNSRIIGKRFRIVHVFFGDKIFEVTTFRSLSEGTVGNLFGTIEEDVYRRDFTLNALYYDPIKHQIIDYVGGVRDIKNKKIVPVISLKHIFTEDPVRMLRAIKYSAITGFTIPFCVIKKIKRCSHLLANISPSRLTEEFFKIVNSGHSLDIISKGMETGLYLYLQPLATALLWEKELFRVAYMNSLSELDALCAVTPKVRLGEKLIFLLRDYVNILTHWEDELKNKNTALDLYYITRRECRSFVLPINPQRTELEYAVRACLRNLGVPLRQIKKRLPQKSK